MDFKAGNSYYDLPSLCYYAAERNFRGEPNAIGNVVSHTTYEAVW